ncbi:RNHCP domain-containing protein [Microlunatus endophyticus]
MSAFAVCRTAVSEITARSVFWSLHVDNRPGDRASDCGGLMEPVRLDRPRGRVLRSCTCASCAVTSLVTGSPETTRSSRTPGKRSHASKSVRPGSDADRPMGAAGGLASGTRCRDQPSQGTGVAASVVIHSGLVRESSIGW